ncbi:hypothetical protein GCM10009096_11890 [Parasphingorhabdus litoris]|uniref:DUF1794 domain-containing protein n=1 Tax=Parasphingorhabdus litoris TaxID=394733 RepID=A0ABN1ABK4_9SPHN|nr:hypothetical protein [Parasphingorhabdus litoris]
MISALLWLPVMLAMEAPAPKDKTDTPHWLVGHWIGQGTLFKQPAKMILSVCPLSDDSGLELEYKVLAESEDGTKTRFTGRADYFPDGKGRWRGSWVGSNEVDHELTAFVSDKTFTATWHNETVETGQTRYELGITGQLKVTDFVLRDGARFEPFAQANYEKTSDCESSAEDRVQ